MTADSEILIIRKDKSNYKETLFVLCVVGLVIYSPLMGATLFLLGLISLLVYNVRFKNEELNSEILDDAVARNVYYEKLNDSEVKLKFTCLDEKIHGNYYRTWSNLKQNHLKLFSITIESSIDKKLDGIFSPFLYETGKGFFLQEIIKRETFFTTKLIWLDKEELIKGEAKDIGYFYLNKTDRHQFSGKNNSGEIEIKFIDRTSLLQ